MNDPLAPEQLNYLRSLVRMELRKRTRARARVARRPGQTAADFAAFVVHIEEHLDFVQALLEALDRRYLTRDDPGSPGPPEPPALDEQGAPCSDAPDASRLDGPDSGRSPAGTGVPGPDAPDASRLDERRRLAADRAFEDYAFHPRVLEACSGWERTDPGREWTRPVFLATGGDTPTERATFVVRFVDDTSAAIAEAYCAAVREEG